MLTLLLGMALAAPLPCEKDDLSTERLAASVVQAERALQTADAVGFAEATDLMRLGLRCLEAVPEPGLVARVHRVLGLQLVAQGERGSGTALLAAAARLGVADDLLGELPEGNPLRQASAAAAALPAGTRPLPAPAPSVQLWADGTLADAALPANHAVLLQVQADATLQTSVVLPGESLPSYPLAPPPPPVVAPELPSPAEPAVARRTGHRLPLALASGALSVAAAGMAVGSVIAHQSFHSEAPQDLVELEALQATTNGLTVGAGAAGVLALGCTATLVFTW